MRPTDRRRADGADAQARSRSRSSATGSPTSSCWTRTSWLPDSASPTRRGRVACEVAGSAPIGALAAGRVDTAGAPQRGVRRVGWQHPPRPGGAAAQFRRRFARGRASRPPAPLAWHADAAHRAGARTAALARASRRPAVLRREIELEALGLVRRLELELLDDPGHDGPAVLRADERDARARRGPRGRCGRRGACSSSASAGGSKLTTCVMSAMSMPRAATSVATSARDAAGRELAERALARRLRLRAVHDGGADAGARQLLDQAIGAVPRADEHQRAAVARSTSSSTRVSTGLARRPGRTGARPARRLDALLLAMAARRRASRRSRALAGAVERRREEHGLAVGRACAPRGARPAAGSPCRACDRPRRARAAARARGGRRRAREVVEPPGRRDEDLRARRGAPGSRDADAAVGTRDAQAAGPRDRRDLGGDLRRELAGRHEHERRRRRRRRRRCARRAGCRTRGSCPSRSATARARRGPRARRRRRAAGRRTARPRRGRRGSRHGVEHAERGEGGIPRCSCPRGGRDGSGETPDPNTPKRIRKSSTAGGD